MVGCAGMRYMRYSVSDTAEHGDYTGGPQIVTADTREAMRRMLQAIQQGTYAKQWIAENDVGRPNFNAKGAAEQEHEIERVGAELREMMPFLKPIGSPAAG